MAEGIFEVCFNRQCILICSKEETLEKFTTALRGLVNVYNTLHSNAERAHIYYDITDPHAKILLTHDYCLGDALKDIESYDIDLFEFFQYLETHAPFIDFIDSDVYQAIQRRGFAADNIACTHDVKLFYFALTTNAYILGLPCEKWDSSYIICYNHGLPQDEHTPDDAYTLKNICSEQPDFLRQDNTRVIKKFPQDDCNIYIYFNDHPPPHVHARNNAWCGVVCLENPPTLIAGSIPPAVHSRVLAFITQQLPHMQNAWSVLNPPR